MRYSKLVMATLPVFLAGCLEVFESDSDTFYTQPAPQAPAPASTTPSPSTGLTPGKPCPETGKSDCGCGGTATPERPGIPSSALPISPAAVDASNAEWMPNEGQLVQAGDHLCDLQRKLGRMPSHVEMAAHLQAHMPLSPSQVEKVLEELGL